MSVFIVLTEVKLEIVDNFPVHIFPGKVRWPGIIWPQRCMWEREYNRETEHFL